jgi:exonuclease III
MMNDSDVLLASLNNSPKFDNATTINNFIHLNDDTHTFRNINISSSYYDNTSLINSFSSSNSPIIMSINIQSLQSKYSTLLEFINHLANNNVTIDAIALQETWSIPYKDLFSIPGFHPIITESRPQGRGGGVGFYISNKLKFKKLTSNPPSCPKVFENLTLEILYKNKPIILSNIYRSPNPISGTTNASHMEQFLNHLETHLISLNNLNKTAFILTDANINLFNLNSDQNCFNYFNSIISNGFLPLNTKSTRIQGETHSQIDHILTNADSISNITTGTSATIS